jgi:hypothetical protein
MNEEPDRKSRATTWALPIGAMLLLYLGSYGPYFYLTHKFQAPPAVGKCLADFYLPLRWAFYHTPLKKEFIAYREWWLPKEERVDF